jgi:predicted dehydrogenase
VDSVVNDKPVYTPGEEALEVTRIIDALYQSSDEGREIRFD